MLKKYSRILRHRPLNIINLQYENSRCKIGGFLNESYGIYKYDDPEYDNQIKTLVRDKIFPVFSIKNKEMIEPDSVITFSGDKDFRVEAIKMTLSINLDWVEDVDVYVTLGDDYSGSTLGEYINGNKLESYPITNKDGEIKDSFQYNGSRLTYFSILIFLPSDIYIYDLELVCSIIKHEIKHGYDMFRNVFMLNPINQDIINFNHYREFHKINNKKIVLDFSGGLNQEKKLENATESDIMHFFCDVIDYINIGEIRAYLNNYLDDINRVISGIDRYSPTERLYNNIYSYFDKMKKYIPDRTKVKFCETYGDEYFDNVYFPDNKTRGKHPMTFKFGGKWTAESFNKICNFYKKRIDDEFFSKLDKIRSDVETKFRKDINKKVNWDGKNA